MGLFSDIGKSLLGGATGALGGGVAGGVLGLLGMGGSEKPGVVGRTNLRPLTGAEQSALDNALAEMKRLSASGQGYDPKIFEALFGPYKAALERSYAKRIGDTNYMFKSTGGGPSSVLNSQTRNLMAGMGSDLAGAEGSFMATAAGLQNQRLGAMSGLYSSILNGSQVGASSEQWFPNDNTANAMALGMDALTNKDSWWNKGGSDQLKKFLGGIFRSGSGGGGGSKMFSAGSTATLPRLTAGNSGPSSW